MALLLIEDQSLQTAIRFALDIDGIESRVCTDLPQVPSQADLKNACLVIDQGQDGSETLRTLRRVRALNIELPVIVLVSTPPKLLSDAISQLGAVIIKKPLLGDELAQTIRALTAEPPTRAL
ncbi:hypothetical protein ABVV53_10815 [Novosphingobium sp. RD2P27]|uniref:Response regulator n=1 Tax=Novosphingobium kalidii TaxID=3230299 RepID=A0ABV2D256_9SPHN